MNLFGYKESDSLAIANPDKDVSITGEKKILKNLVFIIIKRRKPKRYLGISDARIAKWLSFQSFQVIPLS